MPSLRYVSIDNQAGTVRFTDHRGLEQVLSASQIPPNFVGDAAKIEAYINGTWIPAHIDTSAYQMVCHVFSVNPPVVSIWCGNIGEPIPPNWWAL
jgi:hypothetical protein